MKNFRFIGLALSLLMALIGPIFPMSSATIVASATPSIYTIKGRILEVYKSNGGKDKFGTPISRELKVTVSGVNGYSQKFSKGGIFWSSRGSSISTYPFSNKLSKVENFRDALASSGFAKGKLFRSAKLCDSNIVDRLILSSLLKSGKIIDLRTSPAIKSCGDPKLPNVQRINYPINSDAVYSRYVTESARRKIFKKVLEEISSGSGSVIVHCSAGKDRTGWTIAMTMYSIGANDIQVRNEYRKTKTVDAAKLKKFDAAILLAKQKYGSIHKYLTNGIGLSSMTISHLKLKFKG